MHRYTTEATIAHALYGQVLLCTDSLTGENVAIKRMNLDAAASRRLFRGGSYVLFEDIATEKLVNHALSAFGGHPNILRLRDDFVEAGYDHFVLDYCDGGELFDIVDSASGRRLELEVARRYFRQILLGVHYMHGRGFAHRDLSLENVLVNGKDECFVCDFGLATTTTARPNDVVGKAFYMAPEVAAGCTYDPVKADVWSLGIMLFMMLTGSPLVEHASDKDSRFQFLKAKGIRKLVEAWRLDHAVNGDALQLLTQMLNFDPALRPSVKAILVHPFVTCQSAKCPISDYTM
ncbi:hypothetical protein AC1031_003105 [Aphanomyces cochlioides]|nr:hypothetical protein AC1031_003105 [Aphanomyces cochlioides]